MKMLTEDEMYEKIIEYKCISKALNIYNKEIRNRKTPIRNLVFIVIFICHIIATLDIIISSIVSNGELSNYLYTVGAFLVYGFFCALYDHIKEKHVLVSIFDMIDSVVEDGYKDHNLSKEEINAISDKIKKNIYSNI